MQEDLLHFIWKYKKISFHQLQTQQQEKLNILDFGFHNTQEGPDFLNARIGIDGQLWAGNVEMHLKSSDWYAHHHETDPNYDNVILHVVWEDDVVIYRRDQSQISTLELKRHIPDTLLKSHQNLMDSTKNNFINCESRIQDVDAVKWSIWEERLFFERLKRKSEQIGMILQKSKNDWEAVLFYLLSRNFGTKTNRTFFGDRAQQLDFSIVRKLRSDHNQLESLFMGHFGLLHIENCTDNYYWQLKKEYTYLRQKFNLEPPMQKPAFFGMRPSNFPTLRISQLANLYHAHENFFRMLMEVEDLSIYYDLLQTCSSVYWETHYTFGKPSRRSKKKMSKAFVDLLLINTIVPLKFTYSRSLGQDWNEQLIALITSVIAEKNSIVTGFKEIGMDTTNAMQSQAKIELYNNYCDQKKCLHCAVGVYLLNRNVYF